MAHTVYFKHVGDTIDYTPSSAVTAGTVVVQEELVGVAVNDIAANTKGALAVSGVFDFPKTAATAYTAGKKVYWDATDEDAQEDADSGTNKPIGLVAEDAASADTLVRCLMSHY